MTLAVSCENREAAERRLPLLLAARVPRKYIFAGPLPEPLDLRGTLRTGQQEIVEDIGSLAG